MQLLTTILVIAIVLVILLMVSMLVTYRHDELLTGASDLQDTIRDLRKQRYVLGRAVLDANPSQTAESLAGQLERYPLIKNEDDEVRWESSWLPRMRRHIDAIGDDAEGAVEFVENEEHLSAARDALVSTENSIANIEGSAVLMWLINTFTTMSRKAPQARDTVKATADGIGGGVRKLRDRTRDMTDSVTSVRPARQYGSTTYFDIGDRSDARTITDTATTAKTTSRTKVGRKGDVTVPMGRANVKTKPGTVYANATSAGGTQAVANGNAKSGNGKVGLAVHATQDGHATSGNTVHAGTSANTTTQSTGSSRRNKKVGWNQVKPTSGANPAKVDVVTNGTAITTENPAKSGTDARPATSAGTGESMYKVYDAKTSLR